MVVSCVGSTRPVAIRRSNRPRATGCVRRTTRALDATASLVRVLVRGGRVLVGQLAVLERGLGAPLGLVVLAHVVVVGRLQVVVGGGHMVGGGLVMVLGRGMLGARRHRSILLWGHDCGNYRALL